MVLVGIGDAICVPAEWFSPADLSLAWADEPERLVHLTAIAAERLNAFVDNICKLGADGFRIVGGEYASVQLGPRGFESLVTPFDKELIGIIHRHGGIAYYHNHGKVTRYLKTLADLGMDALDPLEAPPWGDVDLRDARRIAGDRLCFVGNLDDMEVVNAWPEEEVVKLARERLDAAGTSAFILGGTASGTYGEQGARNFLAIARMVAAGG
jgi:uroporphyrinogen-III decarboxylase